MPHAISWDAAFEASPVSTDQVGQTPDFIRDTRGGAAERLREEHSFRLTDTTNNNQGKHRQGSARAFVNDTNPSTPDTLPADNGEYYVGRLLYKPTTRKLFIYANSAWLDAVLDANGDFTATRDLKATRNVVATNQLQSSVATGTAPLVVASTTKVTNLNADLLDGLNTGNASGNIPVSNGTLNTNLNANFVDGIRFSFPSINLGVSATGTYTLPTLAIGERSSIRVYGRTTTGLTIGNPVTGSYRYLKAIRVLSDADGATPLSTSDYLSLLTTNRAVDTPSAWGISPQSKYFTFEIEYYRVS